MKINKEIIFLILAMLGTAFEATGAEETGRACKRKAEELDYSKGASKIARKKCSGDVGALLPEAACSGECTLRKRRASEDATEAVQPAARKPAAACPAVIKALWAWRNTHVEEDKPAVELSSAALKFLADRKVLVDAAYLDASTENENDPKVLDITARLQQLLLDPEEFAQWVEQTFGDLF